MNAVIDELKQSAAEYFSIHGFPSPRAEEWRYTNVSAIEKKRFLATPKTEPDNIQELLSHYQLDNAWSVILVDGYFYADYSVLNELPEGLTVASINTQLNIISEYFGKAVNYTEHGFIAHNTANFSDGVFIHVVANLVLEKPIQILHIVTQADSLASTRNIIVSETCSEAKVIETFIGVDIAYLSASISEVFVKDNASLTLIKLQAESDKAYHFGGTYIKQARSARFTHHNFAFGGLLSRSEIHSDLETAAECELNGLYVGIKRQHTDNHTRINHLKPNGISRELYKGVLNDRARGVFQGRVIVAEDAQKTDSTMNNRNLLLSADAEADTKPQLEIYADDVKCSHGVTVGQLEEQSVFYLQARGVDEETARNMLTFAFANEMVNKITIPALHDLVLTEVLKRFPQQGIEQGWL
jgi:Fe-S cluster assembly protein SufD